jgi:hypothetical protein
MIPLSNTVRVSPAAAALLANRVLANALQAGNERQRRAFWARLRGSPAAAASREAPSPANTPTPPSGAINVPGRTTLPPKGDNGAYPMPTPNPRPGRPSPGKPGDIFTGGSERFDERLGRYLTDEELAARRAARSRFQEPKTVDQLDADAAREAVEQDRNRELQKIIARRRAIEKSQAADNAKAKPWASAEDGRKAAGVGVAKAAGPRQVGGTGDTAKSKRRGKVIELPPSVTLPLRPREPGLRRTAGALRPQTNQGAIRVRGRSAATLSDQINADRARLRRTLGNRSVSEMPENQRRAVMAKLRGGATRSWEPDPPGWEGASEEERVRLRELKAGLDQVAEQFHPLNGGFGLGGIAVVGTAAAGTAPRLIDAIRQLSPKAARVARGSPHVFPSRFDPKLGTTRPVTISEAKDVLRRWVADRALFDRSRSAAEAAGKLPRGGVPATFSNRSAMTDDQRRAMFAKLRGGGGWSDPPTTGGETPAAEPEPAASAPGAPVLDYRSTTRDFDARIELLQKERARLSAAEPRPPEPHDFETVDTRALRDDLLRQGKPLNDVTAAVREADAHNAAVREATDAILADLKARGVPASKREAALAAELEKIGKADDKARADYDKAILRHREKLAAIDRDIEEEEIRKAEAGEKTQQTAGNAAVREAVAADKARAAAEAAAAKKADADAAKAAAAAGKTKPVDPVAENRLIKARNRAYAEAIIRGDLDLADRLAPGVDHRTNAAAVARLMPSKAELNSPRNQKVMADVIRSLEGTNPHAYPRR